MAMRVAEAGERATAYDLETVLAGIERDQRQNGNRSIRAQAKEMERVLGKPVNDNRLRIALLRKRKPLPRNLKLWGDYLVAIGAMSERELADGIWRGESAPRHLSRFMQRDIDKEHAPVPDSLAGAYLATNAQGRAVRMKVGTPDRYGHMGLTEIRREKGQVVTSHGWAVLTPEDSVLAYLKSPPHGVNHYYRLIFDAQIWAQEKVRWLVMERHAYPLELERYDREAILAAIENPPPREMLLFEREDDDSE